MSFIGDFLFGTEPESKESQVSLLTEQQQRIADFLEPFLTSEDLGGIQGVETPPLSTIQETSLAGLESLTAGIAGGDTEQQQLLQTGRESATDILTRDATDISDFFRTNIEEPSLEFFNEKIAPAISSKFAPSGFFSSERLTSERDAMSELLKFLTQSRESTALGARQQDTSAILQALTSLTGLRGTDQADLTGALVAGELPRTAFREQAISPIQERERRLSAIFKALGIPGLENIVTTTPGTPGLINSLASGLSFSF